MNDKIPDGEEPSNAAALAEIAADVVKVCDRIAEAEQYVPSYEAMTLARLYDGEARTPWQAVPDDSDENRIPSATPGWVDDNDLVAGEQLLSVILDAFRAGDRDVLGRLDDAATLLRGAPDTLPERFAWVTNALTLYAKRMRAGNLWLSFSVCRDSLARWAHPGFARLEPDRLRDGLQQIVEGSSPDLVAAELTIEADAFDASSDPLPGSAAQLDRFRARFNKARNRVK